MSALLLCLLFLRILVILCIHAAVSFASAYLPILLLKILFYLGTEKRLIHVFSLKKSPAVLVQEKLRPKCKMATYTVTFSGKLFIPVY